MLDMSLAAVTGIAFTMLISAARAAQLEAAFSIAEQYTEVPTIEEMVEDDLEVGIGVKFEVRLSSVHFIYRVYMDKVESNGTITYYWTYTIQAPPTRSTCDVYGDEFRLDRYDQLRDELAEFMKDVYSRNAA